MIDEIWKPVIGNESWYEVSSIGRVRSLTRTRQQRLAGGGHRFCTYRGRMLTPHLAAHGYLTVSLLGKTTYVHRLVLEAFDRPSRKSEVACHFDGNKENNTIGNLRWGTEADNNDDRIRHGTSYVPPPMKGIDHPSAKLNELDVERIREQILCGAKQTDVASAFGIRQSSVWSIKERKSWSHI